MQSRNGFTLIELMVVVAIVAILGSIGYPSFMTAILNSRISTQTNSLLGILQYARSEAVTTRTLTRVCGSTDANNATFPKACNTTDWENGVIAFRDIDGNGSAATAELLRIIPASNDGNTIRGVANAATSVDFQTDGTSAQTSSLRVCDSRGVGSSRQVTVNIAGQARSGGNGQCP
ncbi:type IV fimbrial biogenesis protein FimT [Pseudomonas taiwanensis]|uniref:GspH/FimT family pseudopilin n=1 Tax=Pseudomonas taiwanensis TaxID=470150 RepID=UPI0015B900D8|nr:GspH/FimT family pseudopilin [Pseudomonas taiwanensis]NWL79231.1 type IV fimbrial biogenesis protein FimT [Pseudomonas taiwanensis]